MGADSQASKSIKSFGDDFEAYLPTNDEELEEPRRKAARIEATKS